MTIEKHIEHLLDIMDSMPDDTCGDWRDSLAFSVDTMRKYQKIEQIMKSKKMNALNIGLLIPKDMTYILHEIEKVVEDDKI